MNGYCYAPVHVELNGTPIWNGNYYFPYADERLLNLGEFQFASSVAAAGAAIPQYAADHLLANAVYVTTETTRDVLNYTGSLIGDIYTLIAFDFNAYWNSEITVKMDGTDLSYSYRLTTNAGISYLRAGSGYDTKTNYGKTVIMPKVCLMNGGIYYDASFETPYVVGGLDRDGKVNQISVFAAHSGLARIAGTRPSRFYLNFLKESNPDVITNTIDFLNSCRLNNNDPPVDITKRAMANHNSFLKGYLAGQRLKLSRLDRNLADSAPDIRGFSGTVDGGDAYDEKSFLSGLAAGMTSESWPDLNLLFGDD